MICKSPPIGWQCSRPAGHSGPCAASPKWWNLISKISFAFLCLIACVCAGDHRSLVSTQLAVSSMATPAVQTKVPRSQCKVCNGTGKVKAGDTRTVVWADCTNCYDDGKGKGATAELPKPCNCSPCTCGRDCKCKDCKCDPKDVGRKKRLLMFTAKWCKPCIDMAPVFEQWRKKGRTAGDRFDEIEFIDFDARPDLTEKYNITLWPTFILINDGKIGTPVIGSRSLNDLEIMLK